MTDKKTVFITGADGLVGSALRSLDKVYPEFAFFFANRSTCNLTDQESVKDIFDTIRPDYVIHTAARVGGIGRNLNSPVQQFNDNVLMNTNVIKEAHEHGVEKLIAFSSVCVFPAAADVLRESNMHDGPPFPAHWSYAMAKRMVDVQIGAYRSQYNRNYCSVIPGNIFGENDNFNLEDGHVVPSLIHKCHLAKSRKDYFKIWGNGSAMREFLYAKDVSRICLELLRKTAMPQRLIVSGEEEYSIKDIVFKVSNLFDHNKIEWELDKPNGQAKRPSDHTLFRTLFPDFQFTNLDEAMGNTVRWFQENYPNVRM